MIKHSNQHIFSSNVSLDHLRPLREGNATADNMVTEVHSVTRKGSNLPQKQVRPAAMALGHQVASRCLLPTSPTVEQRPQHHP